MSPSHHRCLKICCKRWCLYLCLCICICLGSHHYTRLCLIFVFVTVSLSLLEDLLQELYVFLSLYLRLPLYLFLYLSLSTYVMHVSLFLSLFLYLCLSPFRYRSLRTCCKTCLTTLQSFQSVKWHNFVFLFEVVQVFLFVFEATLEYVFVFVWKIFVQVCRQRCSALHLHLLIQVIPMMTRYGEDKNTVPKA